MKKILGLVLLLSLFVSSAAQAKINLYGQFDVMGASWQGTYYNGFANEQSFTNSRFLIGANFGIEKNMEANVALMYTNSWGSDYVAGQQIDNSTDTGVLSSIRVAEANIVFKNLFDNDRMSLKLGKFFYGEKGDSIFYVGPRDMSKWGYGYSNRYDYGAYDYGMDGAQLTYDTKEKFKIDLAYSKISNESNSENGNTKLNVVIVDAKYKVNDNIKVRGYLYDSETTNNREFGFGNRSETIGIKPEVKFGNIAGALEFAQQFSSVKSKLFDETLEDATFVKVDASYLIDLKKDMTLLPRFTYLRAGNDFWAQLSDANFGLAKSTYWWWWGLYDQESYNIGIDWAVSKYQVSADYFRTSESDGSYQCNEYDVKAVYNYTERVQFYVGYAYLEYADYQDYYYIYTTLGASYKF